MAIRGPRTPHDVPPAAPRPAREQPTSPLQRIVDFGAARTPAEAKRVLVELLASLRAAGFPVPATGSAEGQLGHALKLFQQQHGLPPTGVLDRETHQALLEQGLLSTSPREAQAGPSTTGTEAPARFEISLRPRSITGEIGIGPRGPEAEPLDGTRSARSVEIEQAVDKATRDKPLDLDLKSLLAGLRSAGFPGNGKGAAQLKDALAKLQRAEGLPQTGSVDAKTAEALQRRGIVEERLLPLFVSSDARDPVRASRSDSPADLNSHGPRADGSSSHSGADSARDREGSLRENGPRNEAERTTSVDAHLPTAAGIGHPSEGADARGDVAVPWREGDDGNSPAGDDDLSDSRRGKANVDERPEDDPGAWRVAPLAEQVVVGLAAIARDDDGSGPATYAWDFSLYRPGVYAAKQPAPRIFHLVVSRATAFDPLWAQARDALNAKLRALEPGAPLVEHEDVSRALQRARYRER